MNFVERLLFLIGILILFFFAIIFVGSFGIVLFEEVSTNKAIGQAAVGVAFGLLPMIGGAYLSYRMWQKGKYRKQEFTERKLLQLAKQNGGELTVADVSMNMAITSTEAKELLDQCHLNHLADVQASAKGNVVYRFHVE